MTSGSAWRVAMVAIAAVLLLVGCAPAASSQTTPPVGGAGASTAASQAPTAPPTSAPSPTAAPTPTVPPTPEASPTFVAGPYSVKLTNPEGGLVMDTPAGGVCTNHPFQIPAHNPSVSFVLMFDPNGNSFSYSYSLPDLGETDDAQGIYTLTPHGDGSLTVSVTAQDHVTFTGFDGNMPANYAFDLVPLGSGSCP